MHQVGKLEQCMIPTCLPDLPPLQEIDAVIIGAYYGTGHRGGEVGHTLDRRTHSLCCCWMLHFLCF